VLASEHSHAPCQQPRNPELTNKILDLSAAAWGEITVCTQVRTRSAVAS